MDDNAIKEYLREKLKVRVDFDDITSRVRVTILIDGEDIAYDYVFLK
jgi:hypothetical protein